MLRLLRNALRHPRLIGEAGSWLFQKYVLRRKPTRSHYDVKIGEFVDFSEFHSFKSTMNPDEYRFLKDSDFGEGALIDIGANLGMFSAMVGKLHPDMRLIAFEPGPSTFPALEANLRRNSMAVECQQIALADFNGEVQFAMLEKARANSSISTDGGGITVQAKTLDSVVEELGVDKIGLLKIDTEGYEVSVLKGAAKVLSVIRPAVIFFEVCPVLTRKAGFKASEPAHILADAGYDLFELTENSSLAPVTPEMAELVPRLANWVARPC